MLTEVSKPVLCRIFEDGTVQTDYLTVILRDDVEIARIPSIKVYSPSDPVEADAPEIVKTMTTAARTLSTAVIDVTPVIDPIAEEPLGP